MSVVADIAKQSVQKVKDDLALWILERWDAEVGNRPSQNVHRMVIDTTWRQVYLKVTGEGLPRPIPVKE